MIGISGATANQAKKQTKKPSHDKWKARICGVFKLNRSIEVALLEAAILGLRWGKKWSRGVNRGRKTFVGFALERVSKKLIDFFDGNTLYFVEKIAISYRPDDSIRSESALALGPWPNVKSTRVVASQRTGSRGAKLKLSFADPAA
jgi:hypothetical protein